MRRFLFIILILSTGILQGELTKDSLLDKNSFIYRNDDKKINQKVSITGYTPYKEINENLHSACLMGLPVVESSIQLDIEIQHIQVIEFYNSNLPVYNNNIAYLITTDGNVFLYTQLTVSLQSVNINDRALSTLGSNSAKLTALIFESGSAVSPVFSFSSAAKMAEELPCMPEERCDKSAWVTIGLLPKMLSSNTINCPLFKSDFIVLDESDYSEMHYSEMHYSEMHLASDSR